MISAPEGIICAELEARICQPHKKNRLRNLFLKRHTAGQAVELAWRSTWLDQRAHHAVDIDSDPLKRGLFALLVALAIAAVSRLIGIGLGIATSPRIGVIQDQVYEAITGTAYYRKSG